MRKIAVLSVLFLTVAVVLTACKQSEPVYTGTAAWEGAVPSEAGSLSDAPGQDAAAEQEDRPQAQDAADTQAATGTSVANTPRKNEADGRSDTPDKPASTAASASASTTAPIKPDETPETYSLSDLPKANTANPAKQNSSGKTSGTRTVTTTKRSSSASGSSGSGSFGSGSGSSDTADASSAERTTAANPTTTKPVSDGKAVTGTLSYLNNAPVTYLSALNADDLKAFGITDEKQKNDILKNKKDWAAYTIQVDFRNNTDKAMTVYYLNVDEGNGTGDVYVCGDTAGELGMAPGGRISEKFYVLAPRNDTDIEVREKLSYMTMLIQYAQTPEDDNLEPIFQHAKIG